MEPQDSELDLSLANRPQSLRPRDQAGPSERRVRPRYEQIWHGNLQEDARALVIVLQIGSVEPGGREVTFQGIFEGLNSDQVMQQNLLTPRSIGHGRWLEGPIHPLSTDQRSAFITRALQRMFEFLRM
jgi:hypothetical protein